MGNSLGIDLTGKIVMLKKKGFSQGITDFRFKVREDDGGFGAVPYTSGTALLGTFLATGDKGRVDGYDVERLATAEEIGG